MTKYRKKPVVIEAEVFHENTYRESEFLSQAVRDMANVSEAWINNTAKDGRYSIDTLEGCMTVNNGDYIIKGVEGEFYPCKPSIFEATYESMDNNRQLTVGINVEGIAVDEIAEKFRTKITELIYESMYENDLLCLNLNRHEYDF